MYKSYFITGFLFLSGCHSQTNSSVAALSDTVRGRSFINHTLTDTNNKTIHVFVALCDNKYQGIVPVPARIGNGQDPDNNLYWGCGAGVRTYFKASKSWSLLMHYPIDSIKMERLVFKHRRENYYLVADAYNGRNIKQCTIDFLKSCSGLVKDTIVVKGLTLGIYGNASLLSYIGHDGLMDFHLTESYLNADGKKRDAIILACYSKRFFGPHLLSTKANPLLWTTGLMCPEAYTLHDALESYIKREGVTQINKRAAYAYSRYQKCSEKAAANLLVNGW